MLGTKVLTEATSRTRRACEGSAKALLQHLDEGTG